jgi:hypothetical protein
LGFNRLTLDDLINIRRKDTSTKASVKSGDLIKVIIDNEEFIGIVLHVDDQSMKIQNANGEIKWMSLYVIYEVLQYNNKKGDNIGKEKDKQSSGNKKKKQD